LELQDNSASFMSELLPTKQVAGVNRVDFVQNRNYITKLG